MYVHVRYSWCNFINTACMVVKIGSVPRETLPNRPPKDIRKQRTKRYKTTGYRSKIPARPPLEKFSCTHSCSCSTLVCQQTIQDDNQSKNSYRLQLTGNLQLTGVHVVGMHTKSIFPKNN